MNATLIAESPETAPPEAAASPAASAPSRSSGSPWGWTALACILLIGSGAFRAWQGKRLEAPSFHVGPPPFALKSIPTTLGNWRILDGSERRLDPQVALVSGCTDHLIRDYHDVETGCVVTLLLGYGPAESVYAHTPEVCFPASGYQSVADSVDTDLAFADSEGKGRVRSGIYESDAKSGSGFRIEAYYSLRHGGRWDPIVDFKKFRKEPAIYRLLIQRRVLASERREAGNPSEQFLAQLLPEIERRIADSAPAETPR